jgi:methyl coenzyme M reductase beta subunit
MTNLKQTALGEQEGLTKREYFAGLAMQGILANEIVRDILSGNNGMQVPDLIAKYSVQYADALLNQLENK